MRHRQKKLQRQSFGATSVHHSRMVEHWANIVEANTKITAQSLAGGACRQAAHSFMQAALAVGALGAHGTSNPGISTGSGKPQ